MQRLKRCQRCNVAGRQTHSQIAHIGAAAEACPTQKAGDTTGMRNRSVMEIFTSATPIAAGLEAQAGIGTVEHTIVYIQVAYHTGRLAAAGYGTVSLPGQAMTDYDIFGGAVYPKAIFTATGFQRKTVVATAQRTILHQHMARRLDVDAVAPGYPPPKRP